MDSFGAQLLVEQKETSLRRPKELDKRQRQKEWILIFESNAVVALQIKKKIIAKLLNNTANFFHNK